jgi:hypothetical protein
MKLARSAETVGGRVSLRLDYAAPTHGCILMSPSQKPMADSDIIPWLQATMC